MDENSEEKTIEISISGDGVSIIRKVDEGTAREIVNFLMGGTPGYIGGQVGRSEGRVNTRERHEGRDEPRRVSLREFLDETQARRNPDKIAVIGEYMSEHEKQSEFGRDDIKSRFKQAGEAAPANFGRDFNWAIKNGWIAEDAKNPSVYYVTKKGRDAIDAKFASEVTKTTSLKPIGRRRSSRRERGDQVSENEE